MQATVVRSCGHTVPMVLLSLIFLLGELLLKFAAFFRFVTDSGSSADIVRDFEVDIDEFDNE